MIYDIILALLRNNVFCHSCESGNPEPIDSINVLDPRFRRDDTFGVFRNSAIFIQNCDIVLWL